MQEPSTEHLHKFSFHFLTINSKQNNTETSYMIDLIDF